MAEEAGLNGLDLAEVHLLLNDTVGAKAYVEEVLREFARAGLNERATTALACARDIVATERGLEAVVHVKNYVNDLRHDQQLLFVPLPE